MEVNKTLNTETKRKRIELSTFIQRVILSEPSVQGVVVTGSVAMGIARADSDIDAVVFLEPFDLYAIPAEFKWQPDHGTFHGIFATVENAIQFDFKRLDLIKWLKPTFEWPEPNCAELSEGWLAFDRNDQIGPLISERTRYTDKIRKSRLDEAFVQLDQLLNVSKAERTWVTLGPSIAHDRLHAAYDYLLQAIFAYNRRWRPWRSRQLSILFKLPWLPDKIEENILLAANALSDTHEGYQQRLTILHHLFDELLDKCQQNGIYGLNAVNEAFIRQYDEPGRDWNMREWNKKHLEKN
jgi:hypothetical protein